MNGILSEKIAHDSQTIPTPDSARQRIGGAEMHEGYCDVRNPLMESATVNNVLAREVLHPHQM